MHLTLADNHTTVHDDAGSPGFSLLAALSWRHCQLTIYASSAF